MIRQETGKILYPEKRDLLIPSGIPGFWKSTGDVVLTTHHIFTPGIHEVPVSISVNDLPPPNIRDNKNLQEVRTTGRSRLAQLGNHPFDYQTLKNLSDALEDGEIEDGRVNFNAVIMNTGKRAIEVMDQTGLFRLFFFHHKHRAQGRNLTQLVDEGAIVLDKSRKEIDWKWHYRNRESEDEKDIVAIAYRISDDKRMYVPADPLNRPVVIDYKRPDYREAIDEILKPIPQTNEHILWIGETAAEVILNGVDGILSNNVVSDLLFDVNGNQGSQINSHFIDKDSKWPMRVEVLSSTEKENMPNWVIMQFVAS